MLAFVRQQVGHMPRIKLGIHAEELSAKPSAPFLEHAVAFVCGFSPFAVAAAVGVYMPVVRLVGVYLYVLRLARIQLGGELQLIDRLFEEPDRVFIIPEIAMDYLERIFAAIRHGRHLEKTVFARQVVMTWHAVEICKRDLVSRLHEAVFDFRDLRGFFDVRIIMRTMPMPARRERERQRIESKDVRMHVHVFIYFYAGHAGMVKFRSVNIFKWFP